MVVQRRALATHLPREASNAARSLGHWRSPSRRPHIVSKPGLPSFPHITSTGRFPAQGKPEFCCGRAFESMRACHGLPAPRAAIDAHWPHDGLPPNPPNRLAAPASFHLAARFPGMQKPHALATSETARTSTIFNKLEEVVSNESV